MAIRILQSALMVVMLAAFTNGWCAEAEQTPLAPTPASREAPPLKTVDQFREEAVELARKGAPEKAALLLEKLLADNPGDRAIMPDLIVAYSWAGQDAKAVAAFERWFADQDAPAYVLAEIVRVMRDRGDNARSEAIAREGLKRHPDDPSLVNALVATLHRVGRNEDATGLLTELRSRLGADGKPVPAWVDLADGDLATRLRRDDAALAAYRAAAAKAPASAPAWIGIATTSARLRLRNDAMTALDKAAAAAPGTAIVELARIEVHETLLEPTTALPLVDAFLQQHPTHVAAHHTRIRLLLDLGAVSLAKEHVLQHPEIAFDEALRRNIAGDEAALNIEWGDYAAAERATAQNLGGTVKASSSAEPAGTTLRTLYDQIIMFKEQEKMREAVHAYEEARKIDPNPAPEWAVLDAADAWLYLREPEKALALYQDGLRELQRQKRDRFPDNYELLLGVYFCQCDMEDFTAATATLARLDGEIPVYAVGGGVLSPSYAKFDVMIERGWLYGYNRNYQAAEQHLATLLDGAPYNSNVRAAIGYLHYFRDWPRLALEDFQIAAGTDPRDVAAQVGLAYTLNENDRWRDARKLADELAAQAPRHRLVQELALDLRLQMRPYVEAEYETGIGNSLVDSSQLTLRLTQPIQPDRNIYTEAVWLHLNDNGNHTDVFRDRIGTNWRLARDFSVRAAAGLDNYKTTTSLALGMTYAPSDHWTFTSDYDSDTLSLPPKGYAAQVQGWSIGSTAKYRHDERTAFTAGYTWLHLNDGNRVQTFTGLLEQTIWQNAHWKYGVNLDAYHTIDALSPADVAYYSPKYYGACYLVPNVEHIWYRRYESSMTDRFYVGAGPHWESGYNTALVWYIRYEQEWAFSKRFSVLGGVTWSQNRFDGEKTTGISLNLGMKYIF